MTKYLNYARSVWDNNGISFYKGSNTYKLVDTILYQYVVFENLLEDVRKTHHISTATGQELNEIGYMVGLNRKFNESNEKFRARIQTQFRLNFTGSSYDEVAEFVLTLLQVPANFVEFDVRPNEYRPTVVIRGQENVFQQGILTQQEIADFVTQIAPAGHAIVLEQEGSFILKGDGDTDDPDLGLTGDGVTTGGRLSGDIS